MAKKYTDSEMWDWLNAITLKARGASAVTSIMWRNRLKDGTMEAVFFPHPNSDGFHKRTIKQAVYAAMCEDLAWRKK